MKSIGKTLIAIAGLSGVWFLINSILLSLT